MNQVVGEKVKEDCYPAKLIVQLFDRW